jgi:hypothetical protein
MVFLYKDGKKTDAYENLALNTAQIWKVYPN